MFWIVISIIGFYIIFILIARLLSKKDKSDTTHYRPKSSIFMPLTDRRGIEGEREVNYYLRKLLKKDEYLLTNILLPLKNGHKTEIDSIIISRKGIFCIEIKNWVGKIIGDEFSDYWTQEYSDYTLSNRQHRNPYKQNSNHCYALERILDKKYNVNNIVLFFIIEDRTNLYSSSTFSLREFLKYYSSLSDDIIDQDEIEEISNLLKKYQANESEMKEHKEQIERKYGNRDNYS